MSDEALEEPGKYPVETLSEDEARLRHPATYVVTFSIFDENGDRRPVVFVWESEEVADEEGPIALYWLRL